MFNTASCRATLVKNPANPGSAQHRRAAKSGQPHFQSCEFPTKDTSSASPSASRTWPGVPLYFLLALAAIIVWAISGPLFGYSDTWQLVINTGTTIITFLMVFLIQNTQNRDTMALQIKLAELIFVMQGAKNNLATVEDLSDDDLEKLHEEFRSRADQTFASLSERREKAGDKARQH